MGQGRKSSVQVLFDTGCNCAIVRDSIPEREFKSSLLRPGPIDIDVATGVKVQASGEWGMIFPLQDGSYQVMRSLAVPRVTADMSKMYLRPLLGEIRRKYSSHPEIANLNNLKVPQVLGGEIDAIIGIQYANTHPELVFSLPNGLQVFKSKFKAPRDNELLCVGGPLGIVDHITSNVGASTTVRYLNNLIRCYSSSVPKLECFPNEHGNLYESYEDKEILGDKELVKNESIDQKHLENVARKYGFDPNGKPVLQKSLQKLIDNENVVLLENLPVDKQEEIEDIKLNNESKKKVKNGIIFDT